MNISAWRPLKDVPKACGVIVVRGLGMDRVAMYREGDGEDVKRWRVFNEPEISPLIEPLWEYAPVADTYELDRAVQYAVAIAFGQLIGALMTARALRGIGNDWWADVHQSEAIRALKRLHTCMDFPHASEDLNPKTPEPKKMTP